MAPAIGIDLGTTFSRVAVFRDGKVDIIENEMGGRETPSCVAFPDKGRLVGDAAKRQAAMNPGNTIFNVKRLIGRRFDDSTVQEDMKHWPFHVFSSKGKPMLQAQLNGEPQIFAPEEITAMILGKMKEIAEKFLGTKVKDAVITVPAYFNDSQRQATKDAGTIAGLNVLQIINEPSAAALAYGLQKELNGEQKRNVLIYDFGGGTFDATVLTISNGSIFKVRSTSGNTHLGGEDFDRRILQFLAQEFLDKHRKNIQGNPRAMCHLRDASEAAKRDLSSSVTSTIDIDLLFEGIDFETQVSQETFNYLCLDLFQRTLEHVKLALADAKMDTKSIDDIVLVGRSTLIPKVQTLLKNFFSGKELNLSMNPDEAVVYGAAIQAAILSGERNPAIAEFLLVDVNPLSLGINCLNNKTLTFIKRNTHVPIIQQLIFSHTGARNFTRDVYEGEANFASSNSILGNLVFCEVPLNAHGTICVKFKLDTNCILKVSYEKESITDSGNILVLKNNLLEYEIIGMAENFKQFEVERKFELERITERSSLEEHIYDTKTRLSKKEDNFEDDNKKIFCEKALKWLVANPLAAKQEYEMKKKWLRSKVNENDKQVLGKKLLANMNRMRCEGVINEEEDKQELVRTTERNSLELYIQIARTALSKSDNNVHLSDRNKGLKACDDTLTWLQANKMATKEAYEKQKMLLRIQVEKHIPVV